MIRPDKMRPSMLALQKLLVCIRWKAHDKSSYRDIAAIADVAEYLPSLHLDKTDRTDDFRQSLVDLVNHIPECRIALDAFDAENMEGDQS